MDGFREVRRRQVGGPGRQDRPRSGARQGAGTRGRERGDRGAYVLLAGVLAAALLAVVGWRISHAGARPQAPAARTIPSSAPAPAGAPRSPGAAARAPQPPFAPGAARGAAVRSDPFAPPSPPPTAGTGRGVGAGRVPLPPVPPLAPGAVPPFPVVRGPGAMPAVPPAPAYRLVGILQGATSLAIIADEKGTSSIVGPGDALAEGTRVTAIDARHGSVTLLRGGVPLELRMHGGSAP